MLIYPLPRDRMQRNTAIALAFVNAAAAAINNKGKQAPWTARRVAERVTNSDTGTIRENEITVTARYQTRQHIAKVCGVRV